jgi:hypothetical protein
MHAIRYTQYAIFSCLLYPVFILLHIILHLMPNVKRNSKNTGIRHGFRRLTRILESYRVLRMRIALFFCLSVGLMASALCVVLPFGLFLVVFSFSLSGLGSRMDAYRTGTVDSRPKAEG